MIHSLILDQVQAELTASLITNIPEGDPTKAGVVAQGDLQGNPDPDEARISVTLHENDPDAFITSGAMSSLKGDWSDEIEEIECGGSEIWNRRFTVKARCLLVRTGEDKDTARQIAAVIRHRIEKTIAGVSFAGVMNDGEYVSRGAISSDIKSEMIQSGGPPDSYDYFIKVRFSVQTTTGV